MASEVEDGEEETGGCSIRTGIHDLMSVARSGRSSLARETRRMMFGVWGRTFVSYRRQATSYVSDGVPTCSANQRRGLYILRDM